MKYFNNRLTTKVVGIIALSTLGQANAGVNYSDVGDLLWQDNFNTINDTNWNYDQGDGCPALCGWGNAELQSYQQDNVFTQEGSLILEARNETSGSRAFTSGKINSKNKVSIHYGMIEVRMQVPNVDQGLWPAAWMLGTSTLSWPAKGEIDMMEMGHSASQRTAAGHTGAPLNNYVGANVIHYAESACVPGNESCAASSAWQTDNAYVASTPLSDRFITYRTYWTDTQLRFTVVDNGVEHDLYDSPVSITEDATALRKPFYLLLNLAVGGNFTDALTNEQITAPLPAQMKIDYVKVYQLSGMGQVLLGDQTPVESGTFGVFTDTSPTNNKLTPGINSEIYIWNQNSVAAGSTPPAEGDNVIAWHYTTPDQWFGGGFQAHTAHNMSNFADGELKFKIKIPADVNFKVGIADTYTNENWVTFPAFETTYGLHRDGNWAQASIPVSELRGNLVALQSIKNHFNIVSVDGQLPTHSFEMAIDDIRWTGGGNEAPDSDADGVIDSLDTCPDTPANTSVDETGCEILVTPSVTIEAEDYVRFFDTTSGNTGGAYRNDDVDIESSTDTGNGYNLGWTKASEWLEYDVTLGAGTYDISARVASAVGGANYTLSINGQVVSTDNVENTGGWQTYQTHNLEQVTVLSGSHLIRVDINSGDFNLNWLNFTLATPVDTDNDGVNDKNDQCANTPAGAAVDANGCTLAAGSPSAYPGYTGQFDNFTLAIDDRFDNFDSATWSKGDGAVGNEGDCRFQSQGAEVNNGVLALTVRKETIPAGFSQDHQKEKREYGYSCGEIRTNNKFKYGRIEARFRTPTTAVTGFISSLFTYDVNNFEWRELDIELEGGRPGSMQSNYIFGNNADQWNYEWQATRTWGAWERLHATPKATSDWIVYAMEWTPEHVIWYMDGVEVRRMTNDELDGNPMVEPQIEAAWIPENETKIMMNFWIPTREVGVNFGGDPIGNQYPMTAEYDWFRYYEYTPGNVTQPEQPVIVDGITQLDATSAQFTVDTTNWADVHYTLNSADQQNFRMVPSGDTQTHVLSGLANGDIINFNFTYQNNSGEVLETPWLSYTHTDEVNSPDSDNDGVSDLQDNCPNTPAGAQVDANGCELPVSVTPEGISVTSATSVEFYVNNSGWADVHYTLNGAGQQNFRMTHTANRNIKTLAGLTTGDVIDFNFTYLADNGQVIETTWASFTLGTTDSDTDNDGVNDSKDLCANTPPNTQVDINGCPIINDQDNDGVADELDQCPNTPENTQVNAVGCEILPILNEVASANNILVGGADSIKPGYTLYVFDNDLSSTTSTCNNGCAANWPALLVTDSVASGFTNLNTITRLDGTIQVTHKGRPVYFYAGDNAPGQINGEGIAGVWWSINSTVNLGEIKPLYDATTQLEQEITFDRGDALVTRFADRGRDRHAKEDHFQAYDHYLTHYWTHRTAQFQFVDYVAKGGNKIEISFITEWKLGAREFRAWYRGLGTVAEYHGNYMAEGVTEIDNGSYDHNFNKISDTGDQYRYSVIIDDYRPLNWSASDGTLPLAIGQRMEIEVSQFLDAVPEGRNNYYGTTYLYIVGEGLVPWKTVGDFADPSSLREDSYPIALEGWLGGKTTLPYNYTNEPDNHFMQMATNLSNVNGQHFVKGRRIHHTDFKTGQHDENIENGLFPELAGKAGMHYVNTSCSGCHERNGRAAPVEVGISLDKWVFKVGDINGDPDANIGRVLQPGNIGINDAINGEGSVSIASWSETNGLRSPNYRFDRYTPVLFSARIAPQLVGLGLLEAIPEQHILAREDIDDNDANGISGKAQRIIDPVTGDTRLGRFGYKASATSVKHQVAGALNTDMGVMTSVLPTPDCGSAQAQCGNTGSELSNEHLDDLVKYIALLGVRAQRDLDSPQVQQGKTLFTEIGCEGCHTQTFTTSEYHPFTELRNQTIHPYTDLLVHDMGPGLADNLGENQATGAEWRTTPLWGLGLSACVTGGIVNPQGGQGNEQCAAEHSYLHDGRARTIEEAILWHGGESENSKIAFESLSATDKSAVLAFLNSL